jgi:hypothetical protein
VHALRLAAGELALDVHALRELALEAVADRIARGPRWVQAGRSSLPRQDAQE